MPLNTPIFSKSNVLVKSAGRVIRIAAIFSKE